MTAPRPIVPTQPLGVEATRVWTALKNADATCEARAMTDREIAAAASVVERNIIEVVDELNERGMFVVAKSRSGRWLGTPAEALTYVQDLTRRFRNSWLKVRAIRRGIALRQRNEQLSLFGVAS